MSACYGEDCCDALPLVSGFRYGVGEVSSGEYGGAALKCNGSDDSGRSNGNGGPVSTGMRWTSFSTWVGATMVGTTVARLGANKRLKGDA